MRMCRRIQFFLACITWMTPLGFAETMQSELLIVGGTESGCAAALQAARMGVKSITLVNDIEWLGGQFSAEALMAIDENRGPEGYGHGVPFPRSGIFREIVDEIEALNVRKFGVPRPGNTRVITTCLPADAEQVFRQLLQPHIDRGVLKIISNYFPAQVLLDRSKHKVTGVRFESTTATTTTLTVNAKLTIDASDWGDVIRLSGAAYEYGPDLQSRYNEPLAPASREEYPLTDMNPITYCMVLKETDVDQTIAKPGNFDRRNYDGLPYPSDPSWIYESRRLVDRHFFPSVKTPDVVLLCFPAFDYPLDRFTQSVATSLEANERGASYKNIVELSRSQREIVFEDAKQHSLGFLYYLQTIAHEHATNPQQTFRNLKLTDEFGTADHLPFKPYVRESLRLKSQYQLRQQDTLGFGNAANNYATAMFHDPIACWQFEYDFHPTRRHFLDDDPAGPWHPRFRDKRTWGPPYSGRAQFSLRSLVPETMQGLLGGQKNLGYSSIVSSAVRLHDQSVAVGQGCGAVAAVTLQESIPLHQLTWNRAGLNKIWHGLLTSGPVPQTLWPFGDLDPQSEHFVAINQLAVRQLFPLAPNEVEFHASEPAEPEWQQLLEASLVARGLTVELPETPLTRGEIATLLWKQIQPQLTASILRMDQQDADLDEIPDHDDPLPMIPGRSSWGIWTPPPEADGLPAAALLEGKAQQRFNFTGQSEIISGFTNDHGRVASSKSHHGWQQSIEQNQRKRNHYSEAIRDTFLFTRSHDIWELQLPPGEYAVTVCIGDSGHEQVGQNVTIEGEAALRNVTTPAGQFLEKSCNVKVDDGHLTIEIGLPGATTNTCLNWLIVQPLAERSSS